jgi:hypothetical protein
MGNDSTVIGGSENTAEGAYSTVAGGSENAAYGPSSFAAGSEATASYDGSFVWADDTGNTFSDTGPDQFCIRAAGGLLLNVSGSSGLHPAACQINSTSANGVGLFVAQSSSDAAAVFVNTGAGDIIKGFSGGTGGNLVFEVVNSGTVYAKGVALTSDRNAKEHFAPRSPRCPSANGITKTTPPRSGTSVPWRRIFTRPLVWTARTTNIFRSSMKAASPWPQSKA